jgi:hypothetical protein
VTLQHFYYNKDTRTWAGQDITWSEALYTWAGAETQKVDPDVSVHLRTEAKEWVPGITPEQMWKRPVSYNLNASPVICSFTKLSHTADLLLHYDFANQSEVEVRDLSKSRYNGYVTGSMNRVQIMGDGPTGVFRYLTQGSRLEIAKLASVFPSAGTVEFWFQGAPSGSSLFSVTDEITEEFQQACIRIRSLA